MSMIAFGRDICSDLTLSEQREWLVTNGIGGYACGTISGLLTRCYHGSLTAALNPPLGRTLLVSKLEETVHYGGDRIPLSTNRWADGSIAPHGYIHIEAFYLDGAIPVWNFACRDALLEKRVWMEQGANTTYVRYQLHRATQPLTLTLKVLVNYRDYHQTTQANGWRMNITPIEQGVKVHAFDQATPFYLWADKGTLLEAHDWYYGFDLAIERYRGLGDRDDHLHAATLQVVLSPGDAISMVASTDPYANTDGTVALASRHQYELGLLNRWSSTPYLITENAPDWIKQLVLAADQFIVDRPLLNQPDGKTIIAGYPWFGDWGRDTMISLAGLTVYTGRPEIARPILRTFAHYIDQGMLPNVFPDAGETPDYNTIDATLWYFEAIWSYYTATRDDDLLDELFPALADIIHWHQHGTRHNIHWDSTDGLLYGGESGVQLTWMDAKVDDWVVTPRVGKPVEVNALWHNALGIMAAIANILDKPHDTYQQLAQQTAHGFSRFWNSRMGYCYDVIDTPTGNDESLRPNQIFAISLSSSRSPALIPLLSADRQRCVLNACSQALLTSHGLRSLAPHDLHYQGQYGGNRHQRDGAYHQGTVWGWLLGPMAIAHLQIYQNPIQAQQILSPFANHLQSHCVGNLSEIFDGDAPMTPRGAFAQAWTVAEILRAWLAVEAANQQA
ncbi:MAG: amylo-alpha-1,6-glucosidase [Elainellaceae cyanobacterium]